MCKTLIASFRPGCLRWRQEGMGISSRLVPNTLCAGSRAARSPLPSSHPWLVLGVRVPEGPRLSSRAHAPPRPAAAALSAGTRTRRPVRKLTEPDTENAERTGRRLERRPYPGPRAQEATPSLSPQTRSPRCPEPRPLTSTTELRTASDTLCRSSAAVPGLLSRLVNLRTSAMAAGAGLGGRAHCPGPSRPRPLPIPLLTRRPAGHNAARRSPHLPPSRGSSLDLCFPPVLARCPAPRRRRPLPPLESRSRARYQPKEEGVSGRKGVRTGKEKWGGGRGHEGREGKWQPLGLRPQLMLLVQPHPGGEVWLLHFSPGGGGAE